MGFNTAVVVLNDHLSGIENDKEFGQKLAHAMRGHFAGERSYLNEAKVIASAHADDETVIVMHGNTGKVLNPHALGSRRVSTEDAERILNDLANMYGFKLVKR